MTADGVEPRAGISCSVRLQLYEVYQGESLRITINKFTKMVIRYRKKINR